MFTTVCDAGEVGTVSKISNCQPEGPGFNRQPGRGFNFRRPSFATLSVGLASRRLIGGLERTHALVNKSRLMSVLWPGISSLHAPRSCTGRIAAARGTLCLLSVQPREQQVAEKPYRSTCIHHHVTHLFKDFGILSLASSFSSSLSTRWRCLL